MADELLDLVFRIFESHFGKPLSLHQINGCKAIAAAIRERFVVIPAMCQKCGVRFISKQTEVSHDCYPIPADLPWEKIGNEISEAKKQMAEREIAEAADARRQVEEYKREHPTLADERKEE